MDFRKEDREYREFSFVWHVLKCYEGILDEGLKSYKTFWSIKFYFHQYYLTFLETRQKYDLSNKNKLLKVKTTRSN